jgi:hypothetical protein
MYYTKPDYYTIVVGCVCLLTFLAIVFLNPKERLSKNEPTKKEAVSPDELKKSLDEISKNLEKIRVELEKQDVQGKE